MAGLHRSVFPKIHRSVALKCDSFRFQPRPLRFTSAEGIRIGKLAFAVYDSMAGNILGIGVFVEDVSDGS